MATNFQYSPNDLVSLAINPQTRSQAEQYLRGQFGQVALTNPTQRGINPRSDDNGAQWFDAYTTDYTDPTLAAWQQTGDWNAGREGRYSRQPYIGTGSLGNRNQYYQQGDEFSPGGLTGPGGYLADLTPDFRDERGYGRYVGVYDDQGNLTDLRFEKRNLSGGWLSENMGTWGPLLVAAAAMLGASAAAGAAGGEAAAGGTAAPISASTPTWTAGLPEAAGAGVEAGMAGVGASSWGTATPALSSAGGSFFDKLSSMFSGDKALNWLPAVANTISQNRQGNYRQDIADRMLNNRQGFVDELQRTYENPQAYLDGPEYQAIAGTTLNQLMRKDAARGRLANDAERQKLMQDHAFNWLNDRRKTLVQAITGNPFGSDMLQQGTQGLADIYGMFNSIFDMLGFNQGRQAWSFDPQRGYVFELGKV